MADWLYYWVRWIYKCPNGHPNTLNAYYRANSIEKVKVALQGQALYCSKCPPNSVLNNHNSPVDFEINTLTPSQFSELKVGAFTIP